MEGGIEDGKKPLSFIIILSFDEAAVCTVKKGSRDDKIHL